MTRLAPAVVALFLILSGCILGPQAPEAQDSGFQGRAWIGPTCPVERDPPEPGCEDRPFETNLRVLQQATGESVRTFRSAADGTFKVAIEPGEYRIEAADAGTMNSCQASPFRVRAHEYTLVRVDCDSGIRF